ncbi:MAG: pyridoxal phosphate-dependent aminotransferase [Thermaerobacter sp.]|nr:pyridoxal phosphate-dependent aminotransferase [Thermaerobacter sp.]
MRLSPAAEAIPRSGIRAMAALAQGKEGLLHLEYGEPGFFAPEAVRRAAARAVMEERIVYTPTDGPLELKREIAAKLLRVNRVAVDPEQVFVTHGGVGALYASLGSVLGPGDRILMPDPGWPNVLGQVYTLGAEPVFYPLEAERGFQPEPESWPVDERTRAVLINNPSNPTGAQFGRDMLERIAAFARKHELWVLSDEVYDQVYFGERPISMLEVYPEGTLASFSFSKTYAMTGWRLGYAVLQPGMRDWTTKVVESCYSSSSMVAQRAALAALTEVGEAEIQRMVDSYRATRDRALAILAQAGRQRYVPEGAFYLMLPVPRGVSSESFARLLLERKGLVVVPGSTFGKRADAEVRISLAAGEETVADGVSRILELTQEFEYGASHLGI